MVILTGTTNLSLGDNQVIRICEAGHVWYIWDSKWEGLYS